MRCPKCEEGTIRHITLKRHKKDAFVCDFCNTLWLVGEDIKFNTGRPFNVVNMEGDIEYGTEDYEDEDEDVRSARFTEFR